MAGNYYPYATNSFGQNGYYNGMNPWQQQAQNFQPQMPVQPQAQQPVQTAPAPAYNAVPMKSNKIFVTSLDEALNRFAEPNSETIYLHQDQPLLFEVKVDAQGRKVYNTYELHQPQQNTPQNANNASQETPKIDIDLKGYVKEEDFNELTERFGELNERFNNLLKQLRAPRRSETVREEE